MRIARRKDGWWIEGVPPYTVGDFEYSDYGPYRARREAEQTRRGLLRSLAELGLDHREFTYAPPRPLTPTSAATTALGPAAPAQPVSCSAIPATAGTQLTHF